MESRQCSRAAEAVVLADMGACTPQNALSQTRGKGKWKLLEYEAGGLAGRCVAAGPLTQAPPLTLRLGRTGWHAVSLGLAWHYGERNLIRAKFTGDLAYHHRCHKVGQDEIQEVYLAAADLTGRDLHVAQQSAGYAKACTLMYVKLVPLAEREVAEVRKRSAESQTRRLVATIDGLSFIYDRRPTSEEELLEEIERYRGTDFGTIWYGGAEVGLGSYHRPLVDDYPGAGYAHFAEAVRELERKGIDINRVVVTAAHDLGAKIHMSMRPAGWAHPVPFEEYNAPFYIEHPEWRCRDRDGSPVLRMSFAAPEVQAEVVRLLAESLRSGADGVNILFNRGCSLVLWEEPFCVLFRERYGEEATRSPDDDRRVLELRAEIMTGFMRRLRSRLDEDGAFRGARGRTEISVMLPGTESLNRANGLDPRRWAAEGLIDAIGMDWAALDAYSVVDRGAHYDFTYYRDITQATGVPFFPLMNPIEWESLGDPDRKSHGYLVGDVRRRGLRYFDEGAAGLLFWDVSDAAQDGVLWPVIRNMGHVDELRRTATEPPPEPVRTSIKRWGGVVYGGRYNPWAGG
jgi:hypothetical protein